MATPPPPHGGASASSLIPSRTNIPVTATQDHPVGKGGAVGQGVPIGASGEDAVGEMDVVEGQGFGNGGDALGGRPAPSE